LFNNQLITHYNIAVSGCVPVLRQASLFETVSLDKCQR